MLRRNRKGEQMKMEEIDMQLYNGDCLEIMKNIADKSVDMILCDLPYGTTQNKWDRIIPLDRLWEQYTRVIKNKGLIVLTADGIFSAKLILSNEKMYRYSLIWDKQRGCDFLNANKKPLKSHEDILLFYKKQPTYNKQYWYSKPYKKTTNGSLSTNYGSRKEAASESDDGRRNPLSILRFPRDGERVHPTQKPVALFEYLIKTYTNENDTVLDNCMGSGTTGVACQHFNRNFIGIELDETYFNIAKNRIENAHEEEVLFSLKQEAPPL